MTEAGEVRRSYSLRHAALHHSHQSLFRPIASRRPSMGVAATARTIDSNCACFPCLFTVGSMRLCDFFQNEYVASQVALPNDNLGSDHVRYAISNRLLAACWLGVYGCFAALWPSSRWCRCRPYHAKLTRRNLCFRQLSSRSRARVRELRPLWPCGCSHW